jgi:hypothetical protein
MIQLIKNLRTVVMAMPLEERVKYRNTMLFPYNTSAKNVRMYLSIVLSICVGIIISVCLFMGVTAFESKYNLNVILHFILFFFAVDACLSITLMKALKVYQNGLEWRLSHEKHKKSKLEAEIVTKMIKEMSIKLGIDLDAPTDPITSVKSEIEAFELHQSKFDPTKEPNPISDVLDIITDMDKQQ